MVKNDMQMQIIQALFNEVCALKHMPKQWRDDCKDNDDIYVIRRECGRGTIDNGAAEHFDWLDDDYDYCERTYDCYNCVYECPKFEELTDSVNNVISKYQKLYPTSKVTVSIDGHKSIFHLKVHFNLSDEDFNSYMKRLEVKENKTKKDDGGIVMSERGKEIVIWLQSQPTKAYSAREIAEGLFCSSRAIPGAMRKLQDDGFIAVEKVGSAPNQYKLTDLGAKVIIDEA